MVFVESRRFVFVEYDELYLCSLFLLNVKNFIIIFFESRNFVFFKCHELLYVFVETRNYVFVKCD